MDTNIAAVDLDLRDRRFLDNHRARVVHVRRISAEKYEYTLFGISERVWLIASALAFVCWGLL